MKKYILSILFVIACVTGLSAARKIEFRVITSLSMITIEDYDNSNAQFNAQFNGGFGKITWEKHLQTDDLISSTDEYRLLWPGGSTAFFTFADIEDVVIDQISIPITNFADVIVAMAPYFFV